MKIKNINKFVYPAVIIVSAMIIGGSFVWVQHNKQQSIERQQRLELEEKRKELELEREESEVKAEQEHKEYIAKRKKDCYEIYEKEREAYNNVLHQNYIEKDDVCRITYKASKGEWKDTDCEELKPEYNKDFPGLYSYFYREYTNCKENQFDKEF
ncbi:hypothetical protein KKF19_03560 [Patescibacteria group bacterium]|nr:hypothetical protein [Patescibacteria group bacterium]